MNLTKSISYELPRITEAGDKEGFINYEYMLPGTGTLLLER